MKENEKNLNAQEIMNDSPKYPERASERTDEQPSCEGVYAGPEQMMQPAPQMPVNADPSAPSAMMTYAGPGFWNGPSAFSSALVSSPAIGINMQSSSKALDTDGVFCEICGGKNLKSSRFCTECGSPLKAINGGTQGNGNEP